MNDAVNLSSVNDIASVCSGYGDDDVFDAFSHNALHITVSLYHPHFRTETTSKWWAHSFFVLLVCSAFASNKYQMTTSQIFIWRCSLFVHPEFGLIDVWLKMNWLVVYGGQSTPGAEIAWQQITLNWYSKIGPGTVIKPRLTKLSLSLSIWNFSKRPKPYSYFTSNSKKIENAPLLIQHIRHPIDLYLTSSFTSWLLWTDYAI